MAHQVHVVENVLEANDQIAGDNREALRERGIFSFDLIGSPGCGKTALLEATLQSLAGKVRCGVAVGDLATQRDADRMAQWCDQVVQISTGGLCHLEAQHVQKAMNHMNLDGVEIFIIENVGNLICPVGFDLGQDVKVGMFSVAEGDDKPAKHPYLVRSANLLLLNKIDLLPYVKFDKDVFYRDIKRLNPQVQILEVSVTSGEGMEAWLAWLEQQRVAYAR